MRVISECAGCTCEFERIETGLILPESTARDVFLRRLFCDACLGVIGQLDQHDQVGARSRAEKLESVYVAGWKAALDAATTEIVEGPLKELRGTHLGMLDTWRRRLALSCEAVLRKLRLKNPLDNR